MKLTRPAAVATAAAVLAALAGAGSVGYALAAGGGKVVTACQTRTSVRSITEGSSPARCKAGERRTVWNVSGPQGPRGVAGPQGAPGIHTWPNQNVIGTWFPTIKTISANPQKIAFDGTNFWVTSFNNNTVTEVGPTGAVIRVLHQSGATFQGPRFVVFDGTNVWVADQGSSSMTEINPATGAVIRTVGGASYDFLDLYGLAVTPGGHLWIASVGGSASDPNGQVTEINTSNGSLVQVLNNASYQFNGPSEFAYDGTNLWITNSNGNSVTEINATNGTLVQVLSGGSYGFSAPTGITFDGTHLWVGNYTGASVTEINPSDGSWVQTVSGASYDFSFPNDLLSVGNLVFVVNNEPDALTELNASDGSLNGVLNQGYYGLKFPDGMAFDGSSLWVANSGGDSLTIVPVP